MKLSPRPASLAFAALIAAGMIVWMAWPEERSLSVAGPAGQQEGSADVATPSKAVIESPGETEELAVYSREAVPATAAMDKARKQEIESKVAYVRVLVRSKDDDRLLPGVRVAAFSENGHSAIRARPKTHEPAGMQ
jgi:hypothetical protein